MSRYAISDIHGCLKTFRYMVEEELKVQPTDALYLLGDYIDRGPDSKGVIDFILELQEKGYNVTTLCGNHEDMLLDARDNSGYLDDWLINGGVPALKSFNTDTLFGIPAKYWKFFDELKLYVELDDYLLVHAGFDFSLPDPFSDRQSMLWTRDFEVDKKKLGNRRIVHGHTPISLNEIASTLRKPVSPVINIDGGCVFDSRFGYLTALNLDTLELHALKNREDM
ncbi:metallophosphoesterase family protein [Rufibacter latericius]|uniref:Serine/threonine protein phosphatase n=1 Tax=Rufibacter latericius TaxID=2487040 RepID=A0A3M9MHJ2_9BACT|nr:metallophosphoesterase family protein [Rufibacter latericius]RNI25032.1 serine/threonine protein phosphatase [Rufibacter latericius]